MEDDKKAKVKLRAALKFAADNIQRLAYEMVYAQQVGRMPEDAKVYRLRELVQEAGIQSSISSANSIIKNMAMRAVINYPEPPDHHVLEWREDGLSYCLICHGAEATMPTDCPGSEMTEDQQKGVQDRKLDYQEGKWWRGRPLMYRFIREEELKE